MRRQGRHRASDCKRLIAWVMVAAALIGSTGDLLLAADAPLVGRSITDNRVVWPSWDLVIQTLTLRSYNTFIVVLGTTLLGIAAGVVGTFTYLRKRAMVSDALSHATLPGIACMFLLLGDKNPVGLLSGAAVTGILGVLAVIALRHVSRLKEDAAIGIVLSVFFGTGMVLVTFAQQMKTGDPSGLNRFIYGKPAGMIMMDAVLICVVAAAAIAGVVLFFKEFRIVCFDQQFAATQGWPVNLIDILMMGLLVLTTVVGLQAVGLILVVALLIIPAAAARFWTDGLVKMTLISGLFGALSGYSGSTISALIARLPTGPVIVVCAGILFFISMFFAPRRGVIASLLRRLRLRRRIASQNLLRDLVEIEEALGRGVQVTLPDLLARRRWARADLRRAISQAVRQGMATSDGQQRIRLSRSGRVEGARILRNHRLWEMYLIRHADIAPSHVDRDADQIEHMLPPDLVRELEEALEQQARIPPSPHVEGALS